MALSAKQAKVNEILGSRLRDITAQQFRELMLIVGPVLLLVAGAILLALQFVEPAPPKRVTSTTASQTGGYYATGQKYAAIMKKAGITLDVKTSAGSVENVQRLLDPKSGVDVALLQGGTTNSTESPGIVSLGRIYLEPMWVFYRSEETLDRLSALKGRRVIVGPEGSGTRKLALTLLGPSGVTADNATFQPLAGAAAIEAIATGTADAAFFTSAAEAPQIQTLLRAPGVKVMSLTQAEALTRLFPYLSRIVLPKGAIDLVNNIPAQDVEMVAPMAALVARENLHPALVGLLVEAAREVHKRGGMFQRIGDFPKPLDPEFEMSEDAERYYKAGPSFLKRFLPFWLATFIERMSVIAVPLAGILLPLFKIGPALYKWRIKRRINYWYGRLKALEGSVAADVRNENLEGHRVEVSRIEQAVGSIPVPVAYSDQYYTLRAAIDLVRQRLTTRAVASNASMG